MPVKANITILGAGMGGLTAAAALRKLGYEVRIYEQASRFMRLGAGIQMSPNAIRVLRGLELAPHIEATAFRPASWKNREWDTGAMKFELPLGDAAATRYGTPYLLMHRGDLHAALTSLIPAESICLGKRLIDIDHTGSGVVIRFEDGSEITTDAVIAADGVHSRIREILLGADEPHFSGRVAYRTTFPASLLGDHRIDGCTKWWGPDRHIVIYFVTRSLDEVYFVTSVPEPDWRLESWSATGDLDELRAAFVGFHSDVQHVLQACPKVHKWAIVERDPLKSWISGPVVLLGDACHPMTPYMAQGAATSMEDAVVLARCIDADRDVESAFNRYEGLRKGRTSRIQITSHMNTWMKQRTDPDWVYGYDAWSVPLHMDEEAHGEQPSKVTTL